MRSCTTSNHQAGAKGTVYSIVVVADAREIRPEAGKARSMDVGTRVDEVGTLIRDGGAFYLRRDLGGRFELELHRTPVDLVEKRVRLVGTVVGPDLVNADGVSPA
jgi:hypothetical protein